MRNAGSAKSAANAAIMAIPFAIPGAVLSVVAEVVIPEASAYNADVSYANLQGARLTNANLQPRFRTSKSSIKYYKPGV